MMTVYDDDKENDKNLPRRSMSPLSSRVSQTVDTWALIIFINHDNQISQCPMFPVWKVSPRVSGNPLAIMLFYQAVRGGCLETAALSCPDNISLCVVHHTPTYLSLGQIATAELENFERLHNCSFWPSGLLSLSRREKLTKILVHQKV